MVLHISQHYVVSHFQDMAYFNTLQPWRWMKERESRASVSKPRHPPSAETARNSAFQFVWELVLAQLTRLTLYSLPRWYCALAMHALSLWHYLCLQTMPHDHLRAGTTQDSWRLQWPRRMGWIVGLQGQYPFQWVLYDVYAWFICKARFFLFFFCLAT
jgi:hypothetical protein